MFWRAMPPATGVRVLGDCIAYGTAPICAGQRSHTTSTSAGGCWDVGGAAPSGDGRRRDLPTCAWTSKLSTYMYVQEHITVKIKIGSEISWILSSTIAQNLWPVASLAKHNIIILPNPPPCSMPLS